MYSLKQQTPVFVDKIVLTFWPNCTYASGLWYNIDKKEDRQAVSSDVLEPW